MYVYVRMYREIFIRIFVLIMYTAHQCQSKWTKYSARLRSAHHSSASVAVALVCCRARANLSLVRCMPSAAVVAQNTWTLLRVLARKLVSKKKKIIHFFFGGWCWVGLDWLRGHVDLPVYKSIKLLGKEAPGAGLRSLGGFFFWVDCNVRGSWIVVCRNAWMEGPVVAEVAGFVMRL